MTGSTIFTTKLYNNLLIEKSASIHYRIPSYWFHAVNRLETGSPGLTQTDLSLADGMRKPKNPKPVLGLTMKCYCLAI